MAKKRERTSKAKKKPIGKRSKAAIKKGKSVRVKKRRYRRKKPKVSISKTNIVLNIIVIVVFGYIIYQSGILGDFTKRKSLTAKQPQHSKEKDTPIVKSQDERIVSPKKKPIVKYPEVKKKVTPSKPAAKPKPKLTQPVVKKAPSEKPTQEYTSMPKPKAVVSPVVPVRKPKESLATKPKLVLVIDDIGNTRHYHEKLQALGSDVTYAILPKLPYSSYFSQLSLKTGAEVIVHLPLEAINGMYPGPGLIKTNMSRSQIRELLSSDLESVPNYAGINNHMGSRGTSDFEFMSILLDEIKEKDIFFLDSRTATKGIPAEIGEEIDLAVLERDVFLDNLDDKNYIRKQLQEAVAVAKEKGYAIAIGHYRLNTLEVLGEEIPRIKKEGFVIVSLSDIVDKF